MRRPFTIMTGALALALGTAALYAQTAPAQQPPPAAAQPPAAPAAPKIAFTTDAGLLLIQIKPDQTAAFEEMIGRLKASLAKTDNAEVKQQMSGWKIYKSGEPMGANALYVVTVDPAVKGAEYELFALLQKVLTPEEQRSPEMAELFKKAAAAFATGYNKLNLTQVGGQ
jgi:hypothetical protein